MPKGGRDDGRLGEGDGLTDETALHAGGAEMERVEMQLRRRRDVCCLLREDGNCARCWPAQLYFVALGQSWWRVRGFVPLIASGLEIGEARRDSWQHLGSSWPTGISSTHKKKKRKEIETKVKKNEKNEKNEKNRNKNK